MIFAAVIFQDFGWGDVLLLSLLGFLLGLATKLGPRMRFFEITAAQHPELFRLGRVPALPGSVLAGLAFPAVELLTHWNTPFSSQHATYVFCLIATAVSSAAWLMSESSVLSIDDQRKQREVTEFLSDPNLPAPSGPRLNTSPLWLQVWNLLNFAAFISLMIFAMQNFFNWQ
jgi:hypothetical protein